MCQGGRQGFTLLPFGLRSVGAPQIPSPLPLCLSMSPSLSLPHTLILSDKSWSSLKNKRLTFFFPSLLRSQAPSLACAAIFIPIFLFDPPRIHNIQRERSMQQQPAHPMGPISSVPSANITTEQIQKYLDENKQLILAILDNQNLGRLAECAQYQAQLQKNLLYLAAIADAQPQAPAMRPQMIPHAAVPQAGSQYMQQALIFPPKTSLQFTPQQVQELQQQQQQHLHHPQMMSFHGHMGMRPVGAMNGMHAAPHTESSHTGGGNEAPSGGAGMSEPPRESTPSITADRRGSKPDAGSAASEHAAVQGSGDAETGANPERPEGSKTP